MDIIEFFAAFFIALLSTLSFFAIQMSLIFARSFSVDMQRWSKSDEEKISFG